MLQQSNRKETNIEISHQINQRNVLHLTQIIAQQSNPQHLSTLYTNRGVLYYQLEKYQWALSDFEKAVNLNHLNHAAYFNIFSVSVCDNNNLEALKNLCCGLSCLYLIRGRLRDNESDINKCLKLAENNHEGRLVKALQYRKKGKYSLALNQIQWILDSEPNNKQLLKVRNKLQQLINKQNKEKRDSIHMNNQELENHDNPQQNKSKRFICSLYDDENESFDYFGQIEQKLKEFNEVVNDLYPNQMSKQVGNYYNIYYLNEKLDSSSELGALIQKNTIKDSIKMKKNKNNEENEQQDIKIREELSQQEQYQIISSFHKPLKQPSIEYSISERISQKRKSNKSRFADQEDLLGGSSSDSPSGLDAYLPENRLKNEKSRSGTSNGESSYISVYAHDDENEQIQIKIQNIELIGYSQEEMSQLTSLYCHFDYGGSQILLKSGRFSKEGQQISSQDGKSLRVKVYNKQILAFKDRFLGEGQTEIKRPGKYQISIYPNKITNEENCRVRLTIQRN